MPIIEKGIEAVRGRHDRLQVKTRSVYAPNFVEPEPLQPQKNMGTGLLGLLPEANLLI